MQIPYNLSKRWHFVEIDERPKIFFPKIKFQRVKSVEKALDFDARTATFYWLQNNEIPDDGVQAEYRDDFKMFHFATLISLNFHLRPSLAMSLFDSMIYLLFITVSKQNQIYTSNSTMKS